MLKAIQIELLKSKRTKSFIIATLIVTMGLLWKIAAFLGHTNGVEVFLTIKIFMFLFCRLRLVSLFHVLSVMKKKGERLNYKPVMGEE